MKRKKIVFITGTRADYGKMKPLMKALNNSEKFDVYIFVCGMHLLPAFGGTYKEVLKDKYENVYVAFSLPYTHNASLDFGNTVSSLSAYVENILPDMIIVHGDRMDALAGAVVGALHNIKVGHIEGGELSGTIDESIRHAVSKFSHIHFVCTEEARTRLIQLGEESERIFVIGSPDIDIMVSSELPTLDEARKWYNVDFERYGILMYHPVTTEYDMAGANAEKIVTAAINSEKNYIVVYPNNDLGSEIILSEYKRFAGNKKFRVFPSLRFEYFLAFLKNADFIIGNSSAGIRESGIYGIPAIDIGTRQNGRFSSSTSTNLQHVGENVEEIISAINNVAKYKTRSQLFGDGNSTKKFMQIVEDDRFWNIDVQKHFVDIDM